MTDSQKFLCCSDIFRAAKVLTIAENIFNIVSGSLINLMIIFFFPLNAALLVVVYRNLICLMIVFSLAFMAYLAVEFYGIHKKNKYLILFGCVIRILETISVVIGIIINFYSFFASPPAEEKAPM